jgi:hypothetical protein
LATALFQGALTLKWDWPLGRITLILDRPGAILLGVAALLWIAAHHILAKGALFLAIGVVAATRAAPPWLVLFPATVLALGMGGFPLTGGALAKLRAYRTPLQGALSFDVYPGLKPLG